MSRRTLQLLSGLFVAVQLALTSVGVWADARQELAALTADVHVESPTDGCVQPHDHRLCVLCRAADGLKAAAVSLHAQPMVSVTVWSGAFTQAPRRWAPSGQPFPRGPPTLS